MRYPHDNFPQGWSLVAGNGFGEKTDYGYHEAIDVNDRGGGDSDLGKPIYAEADGVISTIHWHKDKPTFGNHFFLKVVGAWGTRFFHHAHCNAIYVAVGQTVKEGDLLATIGKSGTDYAHDHWACCKAITLDNVANTQAELQEYWENPVEFVEKWKSVIIPSMDPDKQKGIANLDQYRKERKQGAEGSYEGFVNAIIGSDKDLPGKQTDLNSALAAVDSANGRIKALNSTIEVKDEAIGSLKAQLKMTQDALEEAINKPVGTGKIYTNPVAKFFIKLADLAES